jgi:hypothetical protein
LYRLHDRIAIGMKFPHLVAINHVDHAAFCRLQIQRIAGQANQEDVAWLADGRGLYLVARNG